MLNSYLWFDGNRDENEPFDSILARALADYGEQYPGGVPDTCYVNPQQAYEGEIGGISIRPTNTISPGHLWLGIDIL